MKNYQIPELFIFNSVPEDILTVSTLDVKELGAGIEVEWSRFDVKPLG